MLWSCTLVVYVPRSLPLVPVADLFYFSKRHRGGFLLGLTYHLQKCFPVAGLGCFAEVILGGTPRDDEPGKKWKRAQTAIKRGPGGHLCQSLGGEAPVGLAPFLGPEGYRATPGSRRAYSPVSRFFGSSSKYRSTEKEREQRLLCWIMLQSFHLGPTDFLPWTACGSL